MRNRRTSLIVPACFVVVLLSFAPGCSRKKNDEAAGFPVNLSIIFRDGGGISRGDQVKISKVPVGVVSENPELLPPDARKVRIKIRLDRLDPGKFPLNEHLKAVIRSDSLVLAEKYIDLQLSNRPGRLLVENDEIDMTGPAPPDRPGIGLWYKLLSYRELVFDKGPSDGGSISVVVDISAMLGVILVALVMVMDLFLRSFQGAKRTRSSPSLFITVWKLFLIVLGAKLLLSIAQFLVVEGIVQNPPIPPSWFFPPREWKDILEYKFWGVVFFLIVGKFKFDLLARVKGD